jgi:membrane-bound lytic murein transglycosylase D
LRLCALLLLICAPSMAVADEVPLEPAVPVPAASPDAGLVELESLRSAVAFWMRVYLEATTEAGLLHDSRHLGVVYETVRFGDVKGRRARQKQIDRRRRYWRDALRRLADGGEPRDAWERTALTLLEVELGRAPTSRDLRAAAKRVRFQLGQRDKFRNGIIRSGRWEDAMRETFRREGLPEDLAYLPHVESSFNTSAYSKYGAAGVWQFMRRTGRQFMTIDYVIDERLDPMIATRAAARLLKRNYKSLGSWPLAVTAYNHGRAGMARAKRRLGTDDLGVIVREYRSRTFGFASRNFYTQFLAARRILHAYEPYFGPVVRDVPEAVDELELPFYVDVDDLEKHARVSRDVVRHYNPALRPPVFRSGKRLPKGYVLRLPAGTLGPDPNAWLASIPSGKRYAKQHRSNYYQVRRGDTLSGIASRSGTRVSTLVALNNLPSKHRIYPGQVIQLPDSKGGKSKPAPRKFEVVRSAHAAPRPKPAPAPAPAKAPAKAKAPQKVRPLSEPVPTVAADSPWRRVDGDRVIVDADETLGHFADWLEVPTQRLRDLNGIAGGRDLAMGRRLRLDFSRVTPEQFLARRVEYHKGIEEDFFGSFRVEGTLVHTLRRGESLWELSHRVYAVPSWLIRRYNPDLNLRRLAPGATLVIPVVRPIA